MAEHEAKEGRKASDIVADGVIVGLGLIKGKGDGGGDAEGKTQKQNAS